MMKVEPVVPVVITFVIAIMAISIAGLFTAVLAGKKISLQIFHDVSVVMGTCAATYLVGCVARIYFNINVVAH